MPVVCATSHTIGNELIGLAVGNRIGAIGHRNVHRFAPIVLPVGGLPLAGDVKKAAEWESHVVHGNLALGRMRREEIDGRIPDSISGI